MAIPTTAGTGSEVTRNAVLASPEARGEGQPAQPAACCRALALVDPDLLAGCPPPVLAASGLDALSQLIEPFLSARANPLTDALAREGIRARRARCAAPTRPRGRRATTPRSRGPGARQPVRRASAWPTPGLGAVHGFAAPLGGMFAAPHGAVCAALLPRRLGVNLRALRGARAGAPAAARASASWPRC